MTSVITHNRFGVNSSMAVKVSCKACSTSNVTLSGEQTIDGVSCTDGDRVLLVAQTDASENGIYDVDTGAWTRSPDWDNSKDIIAGTSIYVYSGTSNAGTYHIATTGTITVDTTDVTILKNKPSGTTALSSGTASISFSVAQPDTSYQIQLTGDSTGYHYWASKATSGFTITSSISTSTGTVDWTVTR